MSNYIRRFLGTAAMTAAASLIFTLGQPAMAQTPQSTGAGATQGGMTGMNLSADQQARLKQLHEQTRSQMQALRQDQSLSQEDRIQKMKALRQSEKSQLGSILTPEQQQKMAAARASRGEMRGERGGKRGGKRGGGDHGAKLAGALNLSADQQSQVRNIFQSQGQQVQAIRNDQSLNEQDKRAKMQQLHQSMKSQINGVLTTDQQQKFAQMHERMGGRGHGRTGGKNKPEAQQNPGA